MPNKVKKIKWSGAEHLTHDLCAKRKSGYWDVVYGEVDGWVIYTNTRERIVVGHLTRDQAQAQAESMIKKLEA